MKRIQLPRGKVAFVEDSDYAYLAQWMWQLSGGYVVRAPLRPNQAPVYMYHEVVARHPDAPRLNFMWPDYFGENTFDYRCCNLVNVIGPGDGPMRGVYWNKCSGDWEAYIYDGGKRRALGHFNGRLTALTACNKANMVPR